MMGGGESVGITVEIPKTRWLETVKKKKNLNGHSSNTIA